MFRFFYFKTPLYPMQRILPFLLLFLCCSSPLEGYAQCWVQVTKGLNHSIGLKSDGSLWAWGYNGYVQLGDGTAVNKNTPVPIATAVPWQAVSAGQNYNVALKTNGTIWAWGTNNYGEIGNGTSNTFILSPIQIGVATDWVKIMAGHTHTLALKNNGTLWAWGSNNNSQLGDGTNVNRTTPIPIGTATDWLSISPGYTHSLAIKTDGTLWGWGSNANGELGDGTNTGKSVPVQIGTDNNWVAVSTGQYHSKGIKADGTLWTWGRGIFGLHGDGTGSDNTGFNKSSPVQIGTATNWQAVSAGFETVTALKTDGSLWVWGKNNYGQVGDGTFVTRNIPVQNTTAVNCVALSQGMGFHDVAIHANGQLWTWGLNIFGQLGNATNTNSNIPINVDCGALSIEDLGSTQSGITIYPNPVATMLYLETDQTVLTVAVYDIAGRFLTSKTVEQNKVNFSELKTGNYILKIVTTGGIFSHRMLKE